MMPLFTHSRRPFSGRMLIAVLMIIGLILGVMPLDAVQAQSQFANRRQFYSVEELIQLIEKAREAGMSEEDLHKLEIQDGDKVINVMEYIAEIERMRRLKDERLQAFLSKKFLTVNDIFRELVISEPDNIKKLREELVSER